MNFDAYRAQADEIAERCNVRTNNQRIAFGFKSPDALIALAMLSLGGFRPELPGRAS